MHKNIHEKMLKANMWAWEQILENPRQKATLAELSNQAFDTLTENPNAFDFWNEMRGDK